MLVPFFPVRCASAAPLTGVNHDGYSLEDNVDGVTLMLDGVTPVVGDWVLIKDQGSTEQNGLYQVAQVATVTQPWRLVRAAPAGKLMHNQLFYVIEGDTLSGEFWRITTADPITAGITTLAFAEGPVSATEVEGDVTGDVLADDGAAIVTSGADIENSSVNAGSVTTDLLYGSSVETISNGTDVGITDLVTTITTDGAGPYSQALADGTEGQMKFISMITHGSNYVLTPDTPAGYTDITFGAEGEGAMLIFTSGAWAVLSANATVG